MRDVEELRQKRNRLKGRLDAPGLGAQRPVIRAKISVLNWVLNDDAN